MDGRVAWPGAVPLLPGPVGDEPGAEDATGANEAACCAAAPLIGRATAAGEGEVTGTPKAAGVEGAGNRPPPVGSPSALEGGVDGDDGRPRAAGVAGGAKGFTAAGRGRNGAATLGPPMNATSRRTT
ncbi:hypothetical protein [Arthrobacter sp. efr-133-R2A-120]|uniref:hypothetical protein n=1 Tax=unclassified Arthrobacter TaxID=235627 RepID=UPI00254CDB77|nr:hypothetical protein [Arthrobacter sp. efr-133-R2A-120]